jgi:hypothetical protein
MLEDSFEAIDVRIVHLAIALGVSLKNEEEMAAAMRQHVAVPPSQERRIATDRRANSRTGYSAERRVANSWEELRGLLALRYDVLKHCVEQVGVVATRKILTEVEEHLLRRGFKSGDDGIDIDHLFNLP